VVTNWQDVDEDEVDANGLENLAYLTDEELYELARLYVEKGSRELLMEVVAAGREYFFQHDD
jgi:hypothetical protein